MTKKTLTRRRFVATGAAAAGGVIAAPYVSSAQSAGESQHSSGFRLLHAPSITTSNKTTRTRRW